jgi:hypothetical protein
MTDANLAKFNEDKFDQNYELLKRSKNNTNIQSSSQKILAECIAVTVEDNDVCLTLPLGFGDVCVTVPIDIPNGTVAEACIDICKKYGFPCGVEVFVSVAGTRVASQSWGCC